MKKAPKLASNIESILDALLLFITVLRQIFEFIGLPVPILDN